MVFVRRRGDRLYLGCRRRSAISRTRATFEAGKGCWGAGRAEVCRQAESRDADAGRDHAPARRLDGSVRRIAAGAELAGGLHNPPVAILPLARRALRLSTVEFAQRCFVLKELRREHNLLVRWFSIADGPRLEKPLEAKEGPLEHVPRCNRNQVREPEESRQHHDRKAIQVNAFCRVERDLVQEIQALADRPRVDEKSTRHHPLDPASPRE